MCIRLLAFALLLFGAWFVSVPDAQAGCVVEESVTPAAEGDPIRNDRCDTSKNRYTTLGTCLSGESNCKADSPDSYIMVRPVMLSSGQKTADAQILAGPGYVSHMTCQGTDAAATAGTIILHDALTETGTAIFTFTVAALDYHTPIVFPVLTNFATGIYLGYTTTTDMNCTVFYNNP